MLAACSGSQTSPPRPVFEGGSITINHNEESVSDNIPMPERIALDALADLWALLDQFPPSVTNDEPIIPGGTLRIGIVMNWGTIDGILHPSFTTNVNDNFISNIVLPPLLAIDASGQYILGDAHDGPVIMTYHPDEMEIRLVMREGVRIFWQDGVELTLDALVYAYEFNVLINEWARFNIIGLNDFIAGYTTDIAGLILSDDERSLTMRFYDSLSPQIMSRGLIDQPLPRHHFAGISLDAMYGHVNVRENMIGFGAFLFESFNNNIMRLTANEYYFQGRPHLDAITIQMVTEQTVRRALANGDIDVTISFERLRLDEDLNNVSFLGEIASFEQFTFFNLGGRQINAVTDQMEFVPRTDNHPIMDPALRRAIAYAFDQLTMDLEFGTGLSRPATSVLRAFDAMQWIDPNNPGLSLFDLDLANEILDAAGYHWGDDGFRLDLNGAPFYINYLVFTGGNHQRIFNRHRDNLRKIGIDLRTYRGNTTTDNRFRADIEIDPNSDIHMFSQGWNIISVHPMMSFSTFGPLQGTYSFNMSSFAIPGAETFSESLRSQEAWDDTFVRNIYDEWQSLFNYYVPAIPGSWHVNLEAVNHRVANWTLVRGIHHPDARQWHRIGITR